MLALALPASAQEVRSTGMALQQVQAKDFEAPVSVVFPAVMTVFQDAGFRILSADKDTGLITAQGSSEARWTFNIWWGFGKKKETPIVSAFIEQRGANLTRARLNFVMSTGKDRNMLTDERPVTDPSAYREAFEKIEKEIFVRQAMAAPLPPLPPPPPPNKATGSSVAEMPQPAKELPQPASTPSRRWQQAAYSPGLSVAFVDAADIRVADGKARFWVSLHYMPDKGSDRFVSLREADCSTYLFRNISVVYYLGDRVVGTVDVPSGSTLAARGSVNAEVIACACGTRPLGKQFSDPVAAAKLYFDRKNW